MAGSLAGALYIRLNHLPWLRTFDSLFCFAPAYALGRLGCFLAGDGDYGTPSSLPWAVSFPHGLVPTLAPVHPTMLYSAAWELLVFAALTRIDRARPRPGTLLGLYLLATASGRFLVEFLSRNPPLASHLTEAQLVSLAMILAGTVVLLLPRTPQKSPQLDSRARPGAPPPPSSHIHSAGPRSQSPDLTPIPARLCPKTREGGGPPC